MIKNFISKTRRIYQNTDKILKRTCNKFIKTKIDDNENIDVISLCPNTLNLATHGYGHGEVYRFTNFGEVQTILYSDLKDIVRNNKSFVKDGYFYIDNKKALKILDLSKVYKNFPDKKTILNLFKKSSKVFIKVFSSMPSGQQENFAALLVDKIVHNKPVDLNKAKICGDILNRDLFKEANLIQEIYFTNKEI